MYLIQTERLKLRPLTLDDTANLQQIFSDPVAMQYYPSIKDTEETKKWIEKNIAGYKENGFGLWAVIRKDDDKFVGECGITMQNIDGENLPEIGYHILRELWGQGYATEAAIACKDFAFNTLGIGEIFSYMRAENIASRKVAEKAGMTLRKEYINKGFLTVVYSIKN